MAIFHPGVRHSFRMAASIFLMSSSWAQLPPIYVYGNSGSGSSVLSPNGDIALGGGEPFPGYSMLLAGATSYEFSRNVRCMATHSIRNVTSKSSDVDRWLAAEQVYRVLSTYKSFWNYWTGKDPLASDRSFTVIYADGGSETWPIHDPRLSTVTGGLPVPGTLKQGDGVIQPHIACG